MKKLLFLDFVFYVISILILCILKYFNKLIKKEVKALNKGNGNEIPKMEAKRPGEKITYYYSKAISSNFKNYGNSDRITFNFYGEIYINGSFPQCSDKIIIFFDDIFQTEYKYYLYNFINSAKEEQIRAIYK